MVASRLRGLVEHSGAVVTIVDRNLQIEYQNVLVERVLGFGPGALHGTCLLDIVHPEDREQVRTELSGPMQPSPSSTLACRLRHRDGSWRHTETSVENLLGDGAIDGIVLNTRDVTERPACTCRASRR